MQGCGQNPAARCKRLGWVAPGGGPFLALGDWGLCWRKRDGGRDGEGRGGEGREGREGREGEG